MNKYSDIEIQTAKNLLKEGFKWIARDNDGDVYAYTDKPRKNRYWGPHADTWQCDASNGSYLFICTGDVLIFQSVTCEDKDPTILENIVHPQILDDDEKKYLSAVIKPFRNKVGFICKEDFMDYGLQHIVIGLIGANTNVVLPLFKSGAMYKGMERHRRYTLEELGL